MEIFGVGAVVDLVVGHWDWVRGLGPRVDRVGKRVDVRYFSPIEAIDETCAIICGGPWVAVLVVMVEESGMLRRMRLRLGQPQSISSSEILPSICLPGTLATSAPMTVEKSWSWSCVVRFWSRLRP